MSITELITTSSVFSTAFVHATPIQVSTGPIYFYSGLTTLQTIITTVISAPTSTDTASTSSVTTSTSTAATSTSAVPASTSSSDDRFSAGSLAGGIVGGAIAGAILAFLLAFFIMSSRRRKHHRRHSSTESKKHEEIALAGPETVSAPLAHPQRAWELHLPQPADDTKLRQGVRTLYDNLELHIENFYTDSRTTSSSQTTNDNIWKAALQTLETPYLPVPLESLSQQAEAMTVIINHCLAYLVISGIDAHTESSFPFLPEEVTAVPRGAARGDKNRPAFAQALAHHSQLTSFLLTPLPTTLPHFAEHRDASITSAVSTFCTAFAPWAAESSTIGTRSENLIQILIEASDLGLMLYGQPSIFEWRWETSHDTQRVTIAPAFVRVNSEGRVSTTEIVGRRVGDFHSRSNFASLVVDS